MEEFKTIKENISGQIVEKKSKFIANIFYIDSIEEAEEIIKNTKKKYYDAKHNCYAYIVIDKDGNIVERCSDDGEPSGTAGQPILSILKGNNLCNIVVIVTRYFGGILLGTGGLVRAYSQATTNALMQANYIVKERGKEIKVIVSYSEIETFKYFCRKNNIKILKEEYLNNVEFIIEISNEMLEKLKSNLDKNYLKMTKLDIINEKYIEKNINI